MITVIFSSYNGGVRLRRMLDALARVKAPADGWRVIAVDNRSTDDTHAILTSYVDKLPLDVLQEPAPGKNKALNRALAHAAAFDSDLHVFCDDDILAPGTWLEQWRIAADAHPDFGFFAGLTDPHWPAPPPEWIVHQVDRGIVFACHQTHPDAPCDPRIVFGTNMAVRASVFASGLRFNDAIGPDGSATYAMGSETEFVLRLAGLGLKSWFANGPRVEHIIREEQVRPEWILKRAYRYGRGSALLGRPHPLGHSLERIAAKNVVKGLAYPVFERLIPEDRTWARRWNFAFDRGYARGLRELKPPRTIGGTGAVHA